MLARSCILTMTLVGIFVISGGGECTRQYPDKIFSPLGHCNDAMKSADKMHWFENQDAECNAMFKLQARSDGAKTLTRANRIRHAMSAPKKVRTSLIALETKRSNCAKVWGMINPTRLTTKTFKSYDSNLDELTQHAEKPNGNLGSTVTPMTAQDETIEAFNNVMDNILDISSSTVTSIAEATNTSTANNGHVTKSSSKVGGEATQRDLQIEQIESAKEANEWSEPKKVSTAQEPLSGGNNQHGSTKRVGTAEGTTAAPTQHDTNETQNQFLELQHDDLAKPEGMSPAEVRMLQQLQNKYDACAMAKKLYTKKPKPLTPAQLATRVATNLQ